jgi:putative membrane protein (TIGR04086 family)
MKVQLSHLHWGRIILTGVLVFILVVILNTVLLWLVGLVWQQLYQQLIVVQYVSWSTFVLQLLFTVGGGVWIARKVEREAPLHGLLMGLVVALIFLPFSTGFRTPALVELVSFLLTLAAGWLGGVLGRRGR